MKFYTYIFEKIISAENLFLAWDEFKKGKLKKKDVLAFEWNLEKNIFDLQHDLQYHTYKHSVYTSFTITDPKQRKIHKATVRDRVLHHAIFRVLNPLFEPAFIAHSYSCRVGKGTHKGINDLAKILNRVSNNNTRICYALKCDIKKFFDSVNHTILLRIIERKVADSNAMWLLREIIASFYKSPEYQLQLFDSAGTNRERERERERESPSTALRIEERVNSGVGIPIGNLTSQLFANIYMNQFDYFVKHSLKVKHFVRYTDDFIIVSNSREYLADLVAVITKWLRSNLKLELHPNKITIHKFSQGIDFLGYTLLPKYRLLRTKTKRRIFKKLKQKVIGGKTGMVSHESANQSLSSYLGVISHANTYNLSQDLLNQFWFWRKQ